MDHSLNIRSQTYQITFRGQLDDSWRNWFAGFSISIEQGAEGASLTTLTGDVIDQAELRGILTRLWDLNLSLVSVNLINSNILKDVNSRKEIYPDT